MTYNYVVLTSMRRDSFISGVPAGRQRNNIALALLLNPHLVHAVSMSLLGSLYLVETYVIAKQYRQMGWTTSSNNINYGLFHITVFPVLVLRSLLYIHKIYATPVDLSI